jgi:hypothetical protein
MLGATSVGAKHEIHRGFARASSFRSGGLSQSFSDQCANYVKAIWPNFLVMDWDSRGRWCTEASEPTVLVVPGL